MYTTILKNRAYKFYAQRFEKVVLRRNGDGLQSLDFYRTCDTTNISVFYVYGRALVIFDEFVQFEISILIRYKF